MSNFMGVGIFWIGLNRAGSGCWRLDLICLNLSSNALCHCGLIPGIVGLSQLLAIRFSEG